MTANPGTRPDRPEQHPQDLTPALGAAWNHSAMVRTVEKLPGFEVGQMPASES